MIKKKCLNFHWHQLAVLAPVYVYMQHSARPPHLQEWKVDRRGEKAINSGHYVLPAMPKGSPRTLTKS